MLIPPAIAKVLHDRICEMIRDDGRHLDLRVRAHLPAFHEQVLGRLQEAQLALGGGNGVDLAVGFDPVGRVVRVEDGPEQRGEVGLGPDFGGGFVSGRARVSEVDT